MKVLVCGGRDFDDKEAVHRTLWDIHHDEGPITLIIEGGATGADRFARWWAERANVRYETYEADWDDIEAEGAVLRTRNGKTYNALAGIRRNERMLFVGAPDLVVTFPGGTGTAHMARIAERAGVEVRNILA